jgi:hypothetical protein
MNPHPYLRAYLAGAFVPTLVLPLVLTVFIVTRIVLHVPVPIEQALIFPMAVVPSIFGLWNMLWVATHPQTHLPIGLQGALLPFLLLPAGAIIASCLGVLQLGATGFTWFRACYVPYVFAAVGFLFGLAVYYLVWKYIVGSLNRVLGIA